MKGFQNWIEKTLNWPMYAGGIDTSKCGTGTKKLLPLFTWVVPVLIRVVSVPLSFF